MLYTADVFPEPGMTNDLATSGEPPLRFELMQADDIRKYLLHGTTEVRFVLRAIQRSRNLLSAYIDEGGEFFLTSLVAVDDDAILLDWPADDATAARALAAARLTVITSHDKVKIQFAVANPRRVEFEGLPALGAALPDRLLRLQRRDYYRLTTPAAVPLRCSIPLPGGGATDLVVDAQILDLSGGGLAIMAPPPGLAFTVDSQFDGCRLELPPSTVIEASLRVRNVFEVTQRGGTRVRRCGCQFVNLPGAALSLIERYIIRVERERKARESGMG